MSILLKDWPDTCLGDISLNEAELYLGYINLKWEEPSYAYLVKIVRSTYEIIPFQNFTMLLRPRAAPNWETIKEDMLNGLGGLCTTINPFLCALLNLLGFSSCLLSSSMNGKEDSHISFGVNVDDTFYWVDCANGYPYLEPINISKPIKNNFYGFQYFGVVEDANLKIMQSKLATDEIVCNQVVSLVPVPYSNFDQMRLQHYSAVGFGPFLSGLRLNRWSLEGGYIMRDMEISNFPGPFDKVSRDITKSWINKYFNNSTLQELWQESADFLCMK
jgi:hypothetical protein